MCSPFLFFSPYKPLALYLPSWSLQTTDGHERALSVAVVLSLSDAKATVQNLQLLTLDELAAILERSPETIRKDIRRNPDAVPPRLQLPGTRLLRWRASDVDAWLAVNVQKGARND